ncbi:hypothetical protein D9611_011888 [Ephemerocybe angulata]|uniref:Uncharacterized protein n=1 Tax=Ephemerocybe angulata TaxID=980116 RepID=A0A8H5BXL6_9AGAR|nr:hypothetical protein D9611_011888 [Tulosesus angulatus]
MQSSSNPGSHPNDMPATRSRKSQSAQDLHSEIEVLQLKERASTQALAELATLIENMKEMKRLAEERDNVEQRTALIRKKKDYTTMGEAPRSAARGRRVWKEKVLTNPDISWMLMDAQATCGNCKEREIGCYRAIQSEVEKRALDIPEVADGYTLFSRCQECKHRGRKCDLIELEQTTVLGYNSVPAPPPAKKQRKEGTNPMETRPSKIQRTASSAATQNASSKQDSQNEYTKHLQTVEETVQRLAQQQAEKAQSATETIDISDIGHASPDSQGDARASMLNQPPTERIKPEEEDNHPTERLRTKDTTAKERKRERHRQWKARQAYLDVSWERMDDTATCDKCRQFGVRCFRAIHTDVNQATNAPNAQRVLVGDKFYSRCEECRIRGRKCEIIGRNGDEDSEGEELEDAAQGACDVTSARIKRERMREDSVELVNIGGRPLWKWRRIETASANLKPKEEAPEMFLHSVPPARCQTHTRQANAVASSSKTTARALKSKHSTNLGNAEGRLRVLEKHHEFIRAELDAQREAQRDLWVALAHLERPSGDSFDDDGGLEYL